jgi:hypothetical protein
VTKRIMAASGIQEHNEARRRQMRTDRMAYMQSDYMKVCFYFKMDIHDTALKIK